MKHIGDTICHSVKIVPVHDNVTNTFVERVVLRSNHNHPDISASPVENIVQENAFLGIFH